MADTANPIRLSISNIAWDKADDEAVYAEMQAHGFAGLELAPTRVFPQDPYDQLSSAALFGGYLKNKWGFAVPSIQSIWYGQQGSIFRPDEAERLLDYTAGAYRFAHALNCPSLVFGCPKNRTLTAGDDPAAGDRFFRQAGSLAARYGVVLAVEANPPVYTNYLTRTADAFALVRRLGGAGLAVNLDLSTILANGERLRDFAADLDLVSHVHISEPGLAPVRRRPEHAELAAMLKAVGYRGFVSIEMGRTSFDNVRRAIDEIAEVFA